MHEVPFYQAVDVRGSILHPLTIFRGSVMILCIHNTVEYTDPGVATFADSWTLVGCFGLG